MNNEIDLSLVPLEKLFNEAERRCTELIIAYSIEDPQEKNRDWYYYGKGKRSKSVQLAADLLNDVQNNWNGELKTLARIHQDGIL